MDHFDPTKGNRSPHLTFPRSTFVIERGDPQIIPRPEVLRPSRERMPFGGQERGGAGAGELHPDGPGPFPDDLFTATDIRRLPWTRERGNEWTTEAFRTEVIAWLRRFFRARAEWGLVRWDVTEVATGNRQAHRLPPRYQHLRIGVTRRLRGADTRVEVSCDFPFELREAGPARVRLETAVEPALDALLVAIV